MPIKSPFPGMDPYLEQHWRDIHSRLIIYACDAIQGGLPRDLIARVEERVVVDAPPAPERSVYPDVRVVEHGGPAAGGVAVAEPAVATAEPLLVHVATEPASETFIQIMDVGSGGRVVTIIEFLSQSNKLPGDGRRLYRRKQREALDGGVNRVEIDLLRSGRWTMSVPRGVLPPSHRTDACASGGPPGRTWPRCTGSRCESDYPSSVCRCGRPTAMPRWTCKPCWTRRTATGGMIRWTTDLSLTRH